MTAQIPDMVRYKGKRWDLIGFEGDREPFDPQEFGIEPMSPHTACWRGFHCLFAVGYGEFYLSGATVWTLGPERPDIAGVAPLVPQGEHPEFPDCPTMLEYRKLHQPLAYTGEIRLAHGFNDECYEHMGFQHASAYDSVVDLMVRAGRVIHEWDRSLELGFAVRRGAGSDETDIVRWIDERFARRM